MRRPMLVACGKFRWPSEFRLSKLSSAISGVLMHAKSVAYKPLDIHSGIEMLRIRTGQLIQDCCHRLFEAGPSGGLLALLP